MEQKNFNRYDKIEAEDAGDLVNNLGCLLVIVIVIFVVSFIFFM